MPASGASDDRFRLAVDASPAAMIMADRDGVVEFANAETERMFGYRLDELVGSSIDRLVPDCLRDHHAELRRSFFEAPCARPMGAGRDLRARRKDGGDFPVEIALTPIGAPAGSIVLATVVDITARRKAEDDLAQRAGELERANQRLEQFAYVASHDLQEPLRKIAVFAGMMEQAVADADRAAIAHASLSLAASVARARRLVENLLAFSRALGDDAILQPLDIGAEISLAIGDLSEAVAESEAKIRLEAEKVWVNGDAAQFARFVRNILSNAIKYRKPDLAPEVVITVARVDPAIVEMKIADNGIGFEQQYAEEIFQPFKRLHSRKDYPGAGIGLAICRTIADRYGWTIAVASRRGEGTTFTVRLPATAG